MRYHSTRGQAPAVSLSEAVARGLAPDGGLYVPDHFPRVDLEAIGKERSTSGVACRLLEPFFEGDPLAGRLTEICDEAFNFPAPLRDLGRSTAVLELFQGPTAAFKDFGARFLAAALSRLRSPSDPDLTVLVATSGDTGGAVAAAFAGRPGFRVVILYPKGMVSQRQEHQLTCWGGNVTALRVRGDFDACQRLVKEAFGDATLRERHNLTSANSISLGRLLPQMVYYAEASLEYVRRHGREPGFVVPSGNLGNATACFWARRCGLPIREIVLATNANPSLTRFLDEGRWQPAPTVPTLASAMDVGNPSNMERLFDLHGGSAGARGALRATLVTDEQIRETIRRGRSEWGETWDPHTATAVVVRERLGGEDWVLVATAHPAKFEGIVEPLVGATVEIPHALAELLERPAAATEVDPLLPELMAALE
jgi:threonine synthase